jgi:hypothetical protein
MNETHARLCPSPEWADYLHSEILPAVADGRDLGAELIEVGPGPGASAELLRVLRPGGVLIGSESLASVNLLQPSRT